MNSMDTLEQIISIQKGYINILAENHPTVITDDREELLSKLCTAIIHEACELQNLTNWKWWKNSRKEFDMTKAREELIDIMHFVIHAAIVLDMDANDILQEYIKKNNINRERQYIKY
jgi:dimeric dUTPase (all-alpha-NTP-PPase superfamily)